MTRCADSSLVRAAGRSSTSYDEVSMRIARAASVFRRRDKHLPEGLLTWMLRWLLGGGGAAASSAARTAERKKQLLFARRMIAARQNTNRKQTHDKDQRQSEAPESSADHLESLLLRAALECFFSAASPLSTHAAPPRRARGPAALDEVGGQLTPEKIMKHLVQEIEEVDLNLHAAEQLLSLAVAAGTITTFTDADGEPK